MNTQLSEHLTPKPPRVAVNIEWIRKGVGWDCREVYYVGKQRHRRHLGHIGREEWTKLLEQHTGDDLTQVVANWVTERKQLKGELHEYVNRGGTGVAAGSLESDGPFYAAR
jgi:hypothetical protein